MIETIFVELENKEEIEEAKLAVGFLDATVGTARLQFFNKDNNICETYMENISAAEDIINHLKGIFQGKTVFVAETKGVFDEDSRKFVDDIVKKYRYIELAEEIGFTKDQAIKLMMIREMESLNKNLEDTAYNLTCLS